MFVHVVVNPYDPNIDYKAYGSRLFDSAKGLIVKEEEPKDHVHFHGETQLSDAEVTKIVDEMKAQHYKKRENPGSKPVKRKVKDEDLNEDGYQYLMKFKKSRILYKQGFNDEELEELQQKSDEYREQLQSKPGEYLFEKIGPFPPCSLDFLCRAPTGQRKILLKISLHTTAHRLSRSPITKRHFYSNIQVT